jgi:hypothetical protein
VFFPATDFKTNVTAAGAEGSPQSLPAFLPRRSIGRMFFTDKLATAYIHLCIYKKLAKTGSAVSKNVEKVFDARGRYRIQV